MIKPDSSKVLIPNKQIIIENTNYCGAQCIMCPRDKVRYKWEHMEMSLFKKTFDEAVGAGISSLTIGGFGDCFMDPHLEDKLAYAKKRCPKIKVLSSNTCHLVKGNNLKLVSEYIDTFKISMYGMSKAVYEKVHGGTLKFEEIMKNINNVIALPAKRRPYIIMQYLVLPENSNELKEWKDYWEGKADEVIVWLSHNWSGGYSSPVTKITDTKSSKFKSCGRPFAGDFSVCANGEVSVCCFDFNRQLIIGDLRRQSLKEILLGEKLRKIREVHAACDFENTNLICRNCDQIRNRSGALIYSSNKNRKVGQITTHPDFLCDNYNYIPQGSINSNKEKKKNQKKCKLKTCS